MDVEKVIKYIRDGNYSKVALQFNHDMSEGVSIYKKLRNSCKNTEFYIISDKIKEMCCIDSLTAFHAAPDLLIQFGDCCMTSSKYSFDVLLVFSHFDFDIDDFLIKIKELDENEPVLVIYETKIHYMIDLIKEKVLLARNNVKFAKIRAQSHIKILDDSQVEKDAKECNLVYGRDIGQKDESASILLLSTPDSNLYHSFRFSFMNHKFYIYDIIEKDLIIDQKPLNRIVGKRISLIDKASNCENFGILVKTPPIGKFQEIVKKLKLTIRSSGKNCYIVSVGEITPAKLANFATIQVWVLISCNYHSLIDNTEFYQPIITPMECIMALDTQKSYSFSNNVEEFLAFESLTLQDSGDAKILNDERISKNPLWNGIDPFDQNSPQNKIPIIGQHGVAESYDTEPL